MNKIARKYTKAVKKHLVCPAQDRDKYLNLLKKDVEACLEENPDASLHDMETFLGPAQTVAESYLKEIPPEVLNAYERKRKLRKRIAIAGVAVFVVLLILLVTYMSYMHTGSTEIIYAPKEVPASDIASAAVSSSS